MIVHRGELFAVDPRFEDQMLEVAQRAEVQQYVPGGGQDRPTLIAELPLDGIAVIQLKGVLYRDTNWFGPSWATLVQDLQFLKDRPSIKGVIVQIDSGGGSAMGCQEACDVADTFGKPLMVYVTGYCCSAAYRFACHAQQIYATKSAQIGSIGTALTMRDTSKMYAEAGVEVVSSATGPYKSFNVDGLPITQEHRQFMAERVAVEQAGFVASLTKRGLTPAEQTAVSDGRYWSAAEALQLKLIDGIKSVTEVTNGAVLLVQSVPGETDDDVDQALTVGHDEGSETVSGVTGQPAAQSGENQSVTISEIKQLCPGASADFILQQAEIADNTAVKVLQAFAAIQQARIADLQKAQTEQAAVAAAAVSGQQQLAAVLGTAAVGSTSLTQQVAEGAAGKSVVGGPIQQFEALVEEGVKQGMSRQVALGTTVQENPELHSQYLVAVKQMTPEQKIARRRRQVGVTSADFAPASV